MKKILIASMILASSVTANAGSVAFVPPQVTAIEEPARMGGSGAWLIPLVIVAVIALALTQDDHEDDAECLRANAEGVIAEC